MKIVNWIVIWLVVNLLISAILSAVVIELGTWIVPRAAGSIWTLVLTLGAILLTWGIVNFGTSLLAVISLALLQEQIYERCGRSTAFHLPEAEGNQPSWSLSWTRGRVMAALSIAFLASTLIGAAAMHTVELHDDVQITAHRGASGKAPENTLASVREAIKDGTDWVEIDVQESKDGVVVVAHDSDLKKVAGKPVKVWEATADELHAIDIGSYFAPEFKDERVPTLLEVLELCRGKAKLNIELKYYGHDQNLEQKVVDLVEETGMVNDVVIMSLKLDGIRKIQELRPEWTVGLLTAVAAGDLTKVDVDFLAVNTKLATRPFIESAHNKQKEVYVWTVNDPFTMSSMISRGADNLITDHPDLARRVLAERAEMSPIERILVELAFLFGASIPSSEQ